MGFFPRARTAGSQFCGSVFIANDVGNNGLITTGGCCRKAEFSTTTTEIGFLFRRRRWDGWPENRISYSR
jgi:hypothetical protein